MRQRLVAVVTARGPGDSRHRDVPRRSRVRPARPCARQEAVRVVAGGRLRRDFLVSAVVVFQRMLQHGAFRADDVGLRNREGRAIPPNWMADSDRTLLQSLEDSRRLLKLSVHSFAKETEFQSQLKDLFAQKSSASRKKTACVIYLSAHAVVEPLLDNSSKESVKVTESDVILLAAGDDFGSKTPRLRLSEVWNALKNLPPDQKKLLLLDLGRLQNRWRLGVFDNFVIEAVQAAVQREKIPNLLVMTACSSGESSWVSPHLGESGQSVFAHFVARGLAGEADRTEGKSDGRVTVLELFRFVRAGVNGWVQRNRDPAGQHPRLFAENFDDEKVRQAKEDTTFSVVMVGTLKSAEPPSSTKSKTPSAEVLDSLLNQLFQLWKRRNTLADPEPGANAMNNLNPAGFRADSAAVQSGGIPDSSRHRSRQNRIGKNRTAVR